MMNKKLLTLLLLIGGTTALPGIAADFGAWESCWPVADKSNPTGIGPHLYNIQKKIISNESIPGSFNESWNEGSSFWGQCACALGDKNSVIFKFTSGKLGASSYNRGGFIYYPIITDTGQTVHIGFKVHLGGAIDSTVDVDLSNTQGVSNGLIQDKECNEQEGYPFNTGSSGTLSLYIDKPLTGKFNINEANLLTIYASKKMGLFDKPFVNLGFNLDVTIPPQCTINGGQTINVPFDPIAANAFHPDAPVTKPVDLKVTCTNPDDVSKAKITFRGDDFTSAGDVIRTQDEADKVRDDLGIKLKHDSTQITGNSELPLDKTGQLTITATPTQLGSKKPAVGAFNAIATINLRFE